jgi:glutamate synthase (NADPH/NADH) small chain
MLIVAIGTKPNPLVGNTTKGVELNEKNGIIIDEATGRTTREAIYAGGDAVSGSATVILAMGAGKKAAKAIDVYVKEKYEK